MPLLRSGSGSRYLYLPVFTHHALALDAAGEMALFAALINDTSSMDVRKRRKEGSESV